MLGSRGMQHSLNLFKCIFYSEFDNLAGPKVVYQVPEGYLSSEVFDGISEYVITKPHLCGKLITLNAFGKTFLGLPVAIEDTKYHRNALIFNLGLVFDSDSDTTACEPVVRKLASVLRTLETESEFLFNPTKKEKLAGILQKIYTELNYNAQCSIQVDEVNTIFLKLFPQMPDPPPVLDHQVPLCVTDLEAADIEGWDLTMQQVIPFIDGVNYVARIAKLSGISLVLIKRCLSHLLYRGAIRLIDIFQYNNVYAITPQIRRLADSPSMQDACVACVTLHGVNPPPFAKIFSLYTSLHPAITFREFCQEHDLIALGIDDRMLVTFGIVNGFLRRIHKYPIRLDLQNLAPIDPRAPTTPITKSNLYMFMNGSHNYDELCTALGITPDAMDSTLSADLAFIPICK